MRFAKPFSFLALAGLAAACTQVSDKTRDTQIFDGGNGDLSTMNAGIWTDPSGCEHWIIDDGLEGYLDARLTPDGKPVCNSELPRSVATGPFKAGSTFVDPL